MWHISRLKAKNSLGIKCSSQWEQWQMKLLPLTTRKQLPNPHRASHQVSKSTHLCTITREDNKRCEAQPDCCRAGSAPRRGSRGAASAVLTCQWLRGRRGFRFCCHNFSCHSTGCGRMAKRGVSARAVLPGRGTAGWPRGLRPPLSPSAAPQQGQLPPPALPSPSVRPDPQCLGPACASDIYRRATLEIVMLKYGKRVVVFVFAVNWREGKAGGLGITFHSFSFCLPLIVKLLFLEKMQDATFNQYFFWAFINYNHKSMHQSITNFYCSFFKPTLTPLLKL